MDRTESARIDLIRIICILSMMWVHVSPGLSVPSVISGGSMDVIGRVLGNTLGRISVTTLSFVSGYLFWKTAAHRNMRDVVQRLSISICLPALAWSAVFILMALAKVRLLGLSSSSLPATSVGWMAAINAWAGLTGPTANLSLFFIRDLIVSTLIVRLAFPLFRRAPWLPVVMVLPIACVETLAPVLFRPSILVFVTLGAASARSGLTIVGLSLPRIALPAGFLLVISAHLMTANLTDLRFEHLVHNLLNRAGLGFFILAAAHALMANADGRSYAFVSRHCFLAYLSHVPVIGVFWVIWQRVIGGAQDTSYVVFYLLMPPIIMALAVFCGRRLDHAPTRLQILLRGKIVAASGPDPGALAPH